MVIVQSIYHLLGQTVDRLTMYFLLFKKKSNNSSIDRKFNMQFLIFASTRTAKLAVVNFLRILFPFPKIAFLSNRILKKRKKVQWAEKEFQSINGRRGRGVACLVATRTIITNLSTCYMASHPSSDNIYVQQ